ncbi:MaoC family dehydratase [Kordiimonas sp. SCSIO 12603]|uniref:MaoC family dehydratase n=1 Tax=Kordiimonas sp. SCSIO 12603 TaxID=2829596 RepID=UPI002104295D|nr:MaoC family dehydratase [Kordiimonas sp. SCSIO 12603]UTW57210.1 MaoC family dehydratase [Kordiimonas sp. SCSIO 12603]
MSKTVSKEELKDYIGKETGVSDWFLIDQDRINKFADVTLDHQFIHVDPEAAAQTPFGTTIAHGFLTLSMLAHLATSSMLSIEGTKMGVNYGTEKVRFLSPVKVDSEIRARVKLVEVTEKPGNRLLLKNEVTVEINGEQHPALIAEWLTMVFV